MRRQMKLMPIPFKNTILSIMFLLCLFLLQSCSSSINKKSKRLKKKIYIPHDMECADEQLQNLKIINNNTKVYTSF